MKARLPYEYDHTAKGARKRAVAAAMLLFARALWETGERRAFISKWTGALNTATMEIAGYKGSGYFNKEWQDELTHWAEHMRLELPEKYMLVIPGVSIAYGSEQMLLLLLECFALTLVGYGYERIHRVWDKYAELSDLHGKGIAVYSAKDLTAWADEKKIPYKESCC